MPRSVPTPIRGAVPCLLEALFLLAAPADAGTFWRRSDPGPVISSIQRIVGDSTRTVAYEETGTFRLDGDVWRAFPLSTGDVRLSYLPRAEEVFAEGGSLYALTTSLGGNALLSRLDEDGIWRLLSLLDATSYGTRLPTHSSSRFYGFSGGRFVSASLADGAIRQEPPLPAAGRLLVLGDSVRLLAESSLPAKPVYRLDGAAWVPVASWAATALHVSSSGGALFSIESTTEVRRLAADGAQQVITGEFPGPYRGDPGCSACDGVSFVEWRGETFTLGYTSRILQHLSGSAFAPLHPAPPSGRVRAIFSAGDRLYVDGEDDSLYAYDGSAWRVTPSPGGRPGAAAYFEGETRLYASSRGIWRRDENGWAKLPTPPGLLLGSFGALYGDRPVAQVDVDGGAVHVMALSESTGAWEDLGLPAALGAHNPGAALDLFGAGGAVFLVTLSGSLARFDGGEWRVLGPEAPGTGTTVVEAGGAVYALGFFKAYRVSGDSLVPAFDELGYAYAIRDVLAVGDTTYLYVDAPYGSDYESARPVLLSLSEGAVRPILDDRDTRSSFLRLAHVGDDVVIGGAFPRRFYVVTRGELREVRGETRYLDGIDREGRFGWGHDDHAATLLAPSPRVRKTLPVSVDTTGIGGVRYSSSILLANLSALPSTARLTAVAAGRSVAIPLGPSEQRWVDDLFPGFVGPVSIDFEGLDDDRDAFALVRVRNPSEGGTAGTSLAAVDSGSFTGEGVVLPPASLDGSRLHLALANAGDGAGLPLTAYARPPEAGVPGWETDQLHAGEFLQRDDLPPATGATRLESDSPSRTDDLLGYCVRNDATTNDGTVVPFEPSDPLPLRRALFLPAAVSLASPFARYRTELSIARRRYSLIDSETRVRTYHVTYAPLGSHVTWSFPIGLRLGDVLRIDDVAPWLAAHGLPVDPSSLDTALGFTCDEDVGAADLVVTAVVLARPRPGGGEYGVSVPVLNEGRWASSRAMVPGLLENGSTRSNLAVTNPERQGGPSVTLRVTIRSGADGALVGTFPPVTLLPGQRHQLNRPLQAIGFGAGVAFAVIERVEGTGRFVAYGVLNDAATSDGTLLPMARPE